MLRKVENSITVQIITEEFIAPLVTPCLISTMSANLNGEHSSAQACVQT